MAGIGKRHHWASALLVCSAALPAAASAEPSPQDASRVAPDEADTFIDRADALWDVIGDAPPDLAFSFEGAEPWAWQLADGHAIIVEDGEDGIRSYYFEPGRATPFLVVEPGVSFGFVGSRMAAIYGPDGTPLAEGEGADRLDAARALFERGAALKRAMTARGDWRPVDSQAWIEASPTLFGFIQLWNDGRARNPIWHRQHDRWAGAQWRQRFEAERLRRRASAERFRHWREGGFHGVPPGRWQRPGAHSGGRPPQPGRHPRPGWSQPMIPAAGERPTTGPRPQDVAPALPPVWGPDRRRPDRPERIDRGDGSMVPGATNGAGGWRRGQRAPNPAAAPTSPAAATPDAAAPLPRVIRGWPRGNRPNDAGDGRWGRRPGAVTPPASSQPSGPPPWTGNRPMPSRWATPPNVDGQPPRPWGGWRANRAQPSATAPTGILPSSSGRSTPFGNWTRQPRVSPPVTGSTSPAAAPRPPRSGGWARPVPAVPPAAAPSPPSAAPRPAPAARPGMTAGRRGEAPRPQE